MSIHVALTHVTHYEYDRLVEARSANRQAATGAALPDPHTFLLAQDRARPKHFINWQQDPQANYQARLVFPEKTRELRIEVGLVAEMSVFNPFDFFLEP